MRRFQHLDTAGIVVPILRDHDTRRDRGTKGVFRAPRHRCCRFTETDHIEMPHRSEIIGMPGNREDIAYTTQGPRDGGARIYCAQCCTV